jgi:hypothetical protein
MNVESPHLDLENLLAAVSGEATGDQARAHLASCPRCRSEVRRWGIVAGGVRHLVAATPASSWLPGDTSDARRRNRQASAWRNPRRRVLVAAAAACALAAGSTAYGLTAADSRTGTNTVTATARLTAVNGCVDLRATLGTLEQVNGATLMVRSWWSSGHLVTVTTSASTKISQVETGSLSGITDGAHVLVSGTNSGGGIAAQRVSIANSTEQAAPPKPPGGLPRGTVQIPLTSGTVADASAGGFTVITADGTRVPVTTSRSTSVFVVANVGVSQLRAGELTVAVGTAGPNGTLAATTVEQGVVPAGGSGERLQFPVNPSNGISGAPLGCSAPAIATAALLAAG